VELDDIPPGPAVEDAELLTLGVSGGSKHVSVEMSHKRSPLQWASVKQPVGASLDVHAPASHSPMVATTAQVAVGTGDFQLCIL